MALTQPTVTVDRSDIDTEKYCEIAIPSKHYTTIVHTTTVKLVGIACKINFMYCTIIPIAESNFAYKIKHSKLKTK